MTTDLLDDFGATVGVGDIIVYAVSSNSRPKLTRAEILEIGKKKNIYDSYRIKVRPEREANNQRTYGDTRKELWLTRAPFMLVAPAVDFDEYRAGLLARYAEVSA